MKTILVPVDFSKTSLKAYQFAVDLARRDQSDIHLVHVVEQPGVNSWTLANNKLKLPQELESNIFFIKLIEKTKEQIKAFRESVNVDGVHVETHLRMGKTYQNITDTLAESQADMIIMGSQGEDDLVDAIIGSNAEKIVRKSECPVLIIKEELAVDNLKDVVIASEFNEEMDELVDFLKHFQSLLDVNLHLILVSTPSNFSSTHTGKRRINSFIKKHDLKNCEAHVYSDFTEEEGIISYAQSIGAEMIAMTTNGKSSFIEFFAGSISTEVVNTSRRAVLTLKVKK